MVLCDRVLTPEEYIKVNFNIQTELKSNNQVEELEMFIESQNECLWSYPLTETQHVIEEEASVVLVKCVIVDDETKKEKHIFRWFECVFDEIFN